MLKLKKQMYLIQNQRLDFCSQVKTATQYNIFDSYTTLPLQYYSLQNAAPLETVTYQQIGYRQAENRCHNGNRNPHLKAVKQHLPVGLVSNDQLKILAASIYSEL